MTTIVYLARHGITAANKENIFAGRTTEPLHHEGVAQMLAVGRTIAAQGGIKKIFCGPLPRTRQSAELAAGQIAPPGELPVISKEGLNEIFIPHWDGLSKEELRTRFGMEYPCWLEDPAGFAVPGCETIAQVQNRAVACLEEIFQGCAGERVLVVSHLIVIRSLILHCLDRPLADFREIKVGNAQLVMLTRQDQGQTLVRMSCAAD
jgi:broad specificity phosphatase PhoE